MVRCLIGAVAFAIFLAVVTTAQAQDRRVVALTVGINKFDNLHPTAGQLYKAVPDAEALYAALTTDLHIDKSAVALRRDATKAEVLLAWDETLAKLDQEKDGGDAVAIFHFAGHGVELRGQNLLIARDTRIDSQATLRVTSIELQDLFARLAKLQETQRRVVGVFIIDACRENPEFLRNIPGDAGLGVAPPLEKLPHGIFLLFSAGIGQLALDGAGANSVFMTQLLPLLKKTDPRLALPDLAQALRYRVYSEAQKAIIAGNPHRQTPAYYDQLLYRVSLLGDFVAAGVRASALGATTSKLPDRDLSVGSVVMDCETCPELIVIPRAKGGGRLAVGKFEVSKGEWNSCVRQGGCQGLRNVSGGEGRREREPVSDVSLDDAQSYVRWLNTLSQRPAERAYRLPTATEWEFAARGGETADHFRLSRGESLCDYANGADRALGSLLLIDTMACNDGVGRGVAAVGRYKPNGYGLHDVLGNLWEWTQTCATAPGSSAQVCSRYIARGGSWRSPPARLTFTSDNAFARTHARATLGFRVVLDLGD
jgi:uncharacterized caspase-like protein